MNDQERYAQVKRLFQEAVALPTEDRGAFLDAQCGDALELRGDVETLLQHHHCETILSQMRDDSTGHPVSHVLDRRVDDDDTPAHLSPQFVAELLELLRGRLGGLATVLLTGLLFSIIRGVINPQLTLQWHEVVIVVPLTVALWILYSRLSLTLKQLRTIELVMMASMCVLLTTGDVFLMMQGGREANDPDIVGASTRSFLIWCVFILIYGIYVPNTWRRAAMILLPLACAPYLIKSAVSAADPVVDQALGQWSYERPLPMPFFSAFAAIYAAHLFYSNRLATYRARQFAQYRLVRLLGKGGMGEVYEAEHSLLKRSCAIKLIHPNRQHDASTLARFEREVQATAQLTHPNTIDVFDYGQTIDGVFYYVMELLPGLSLAELVERFGPLPASRTCYLLRQVCGALQEAHDANLIHRDIKPGNIFVSERGGNHDVAKVLDFGLVRSQMDALPRRPIVLGTPAFMPPEQGLRSGPVDARSDIYALGATAYYLATGRIPFDDPTPQAQLIAHATQSVCPPTELNGEIPNDVEQVILRCLEKEPDDRYQTMLELRAAIEACGCLHDWSEEEAASWWASHSN